jgi:hypothetical protein
LIFEAIETQRQEGTKALSHCITSSLCIRGLYLFQPETLPKNEAISKAIHCRKDGKKRLTV